MEGQGLIRPMEGGYLLWGHSPSRLQWGLEVLAAAGSHGSCSLADGGEKPSMKGGHSRQDEV